MEDLSGTGTFINGEAQAVEILNSLSATERQRILRQISAKNPQVARELTQKCFNFDALLKLQEDEINQLSNMVNPKILGIALKGAPVNFQKQILHRFYRQYAEICYDALTSPQMSEETTIKRAQARVVEAAVKICATNGKNSKGRKGHD